MWIELQVEATKLLSIQVTHIDYFQLKERNGNNGGNGSSSNGSPLLSCWSMESTITVDPKDMPRGAVVLLLVDESLPTMGEQSSSPPSSTIQFYDTMKQMRATLNLLMEGGNDVDVLVDAATKQDNIDEIHGSVVSNMMRGVGIGLGVALVVVLVAALLLYHNRNQTQKKNHNSDNNANTGNVDSDEHYSHMNDKNKAEANGNQKKMKNRHALSLPSMSPERSDIMSTAPTVRVKNSHQKSSPHSVATEKVNNGN
jgi:hypothetical protein